MAIAAGIEIEAGKGPAPSQDHALGAAQGTRLTGAIARNLSSPTASTAESFRSGWQSLLASLGSNVEDASQTGSEAGLGTTVALLAQGESAGKHSVSTSAKAAWADSSSSQETEKGSGKTSAAAKLSTGDTRTGGLAARTPAETIQAATARTTEKKPAVNSKTESASSSHSARVAAPAVDATGTIAIISPATSAPVVVNTVSDAADKLTRRTETDLTADSFSWQSTDSERPMTAAERMNAGGQTPAGESETSASQNQALSASGLSESSGPTFKQTSISAASESGPRQVAAPVAGESLPELSASGMNQSQTVEQSLNRPLTAVQHQKSTGVRTAGQSSSPGIIPSHEATGTAASSQNSSQAEVGSVSKVQTLASSPIKAPARLADKEGNSASSIGSDELNQLSVATDIAASQPGRTAVPQVIDDSGSAGSGKASVSGTSRSMRGTSSFNSIQRRLPEGKASSPAADATAIVREAAKANEVARTPGASAAGSTAATSGADSRDAFAALDAEGIEGRPAWIHAGTQRAEAGFQDPALGWVGIRANASGGGVHAELVPGSADAAQTLGSHLAGLNAYLAEHRTPVETLTLTAPESGLGSDQGAGDGMQQGTGQQTGQGLAQGADSGSQLGESGSPTTLPAAASEATVLPTGLDGSAQPVWLGGKHISVMA
jgi:hypothetical protein